MRVVRKRFNLSVVFLLISFNAFSVDEVTIAMLEKEVPQFGEIDEGLYRGAQPTDEGIALLKEFGIKTIVNFRHEEDEIEKERKAVEKLGMNYLSLPWRIQFDPAEDVMGAYLKRVSLKEEGPFFIHCRRGAERTGAADAIYRYYVQGLSKKESFRKATEGYHVLFYWRPFIKARIKDFHEKLGLK